MMNCLGQKTARCMFKYGKKFLIQMKTQNSNCMRIQWIIFQSTMTNLQQTSIQTKIKIRN